MWTQPEKETPSSSSSSYVLSSYIVNIRTNLIDFSFSPSCYSQKRFCLIYSFFFNPPPPKKRIRHFRFSCKSIYNFPKRRNISEKLHLYLHKIILKIIDYVLCYLHCKLERITYIKRLNIIFKPIREYLERINSYMG